MTEVISHELGNQEKLVKAFETVDETKQYGEEVTTAE
jgi:hypothetical protein